MARLSFLTPIVFLCSVRPGSGKATMLAHLAVYLNSLGRKIAVVDLDRDTPEKIKSIIPKSISITKYQDIASLRETADSRYQKAFYFTENDEIAYFPAQRIEDPGTLFTDTTLRDFILQARSSYDLILINFPSGTEHCLNVSDLLAQRHLWGNNTPACLMFSQSETRCLNLIDDLLKSSRAMSHQLRENIMLVFNKVPLTVGEQSPLSRQLNPSELRELYEFPYTQIIGNNEEYSQQKNVDKPIVLDNNSLMHQTIATLYRNLGKLGEKTTIGASDPDSFGACLDGMLLQKLAPYLESIHQAVASKLFIPAHQVQVFLEENASTYRIRVRVSDYENAILGISSQIDSFKYSPPIDWSFSLFNSVTLNAIPDCVAIAERQILPKLTASPIPRFDDSSLRHTKFEAFSNLPLIPNQERCPSPIFFKQNHVLPEVPSLSHLLGYLGRRKKYRLFTLKGRPHKNSSLTHFFIPSEFSLTYDLSTFCQTNYLGALNLSEYVRISHTNPTPAQSIFNYSTDYSFSMPDIFARDHSLVFTDFTGNVLCKPSPTLFEATTRTLSHTDSMPEFGTMKFASEARHNSLLQIALIIPQKLPLSEPKLEEPAYESEKLELKPKLEEQFTNINYSLDFRRPNYAFLEYCTHYAFAKFSMQRAQLANKCVIKPVLPESFLSYSKLDLDTSLRRFNPVTEPCPYKTDYYNRLQNKTLPDRLKLHSTLLVQQLLPTPLKSLTDQSFQGRVELTLSQQEYSPDLNISFSIDYLSNQSLYAINTEPDKITEFSFLFTIGALKLSKKQLHTHKPKTLAFDMLGVWFKHKKDNSELCSNYDQLYSSNHVIDSSISNRKLEVRKRDMLSIVSLGSSRFKSISAPSKKKPGLRFTPLALDINFDRNISQLCLELSDKIELTKTDHSQHFDHTSIRQSASAFLLNHNICDAAAIVEPKDATILVQSVIDRSYCQPALNIQAQQFNILETNTHLQHSISESYICQPGSTHHCQPNHTSLSISALMPFRSMKLVLELFASHKDSSQATNDILKDKCQIRNIYGRHSQINGIIEHKNEFFTTAKPLLEQQVLFNKAFDHGEQIVQRKANFRVPPPYPLDALYDHLVVSSRYYFRRLFDHPVFQDHNNAFNKEFAILSNYQNLEKHYEFSHSIFPAIKRGSMPVKAKQFPIRNIKLRDLLKMARQASQHFSEIQGKTTA